MTGKQFALLSLWVSCSFLGGYGQPLGWKGPGGFDYATHLGRTPPSPANPPGLPPGYETTLAHPENFNVRVSGMDFLPDGRLALLHSDYMGRNGRILLAAGIAGPAEEVRFTEIAGGIWGCFGIRVLNGEIFYSAQDGLWKLVRVSGASESWQRVFLAPYIIAGMEGGPDRGSRYPVFNLEHSQGGLYFANGAYKNFNPPGSNLGYAVRYDLATGAQEILGRGIRMPNGLAANAAGDLFFTDNQGEYRPGSPVYHLVKGRHYGMAAPAGLEGNQGGHLLNLMPLPPADSIHLPAVWVPYGGESRSLTNLLLLKQGPFAGHFLAGDNARGLVHRIQLEKVKGEYQGACFPFSGVLEAGIQSFALGSDGTIYGGALGQGPGHNWLGRTHGLMKWKPTGEPVRALRRVSSQRSGFDIEFTEPLAANGGQPEHYWVQSFRYEPTADYGGPKLDVRNHRILELASSTDRTRLALTVEGLEAGRIYRIAIAPALRSAGGQPYFTENAWYTLNRISDIHPLGTGAALSVSGTSRAMPAEIRRQAGALRVRIPQAGPFRIEVTDLRGVSEREAAGHGPVTLDLPLRSAASRVVRLSTPEGAWSQIVGPGGP